MTISVWSVKAAVEAALQTALVPSVADIVQLGRPVETPSLQQPRRVYIGGVLNDSPQPIWEPVSQVRLEEYEIPLMIDCLSFSGNDPAGYATAETLVADIVAAIEAQIGNDPSWSATCHNSGLSLAAAYTSALGDAPSGSGYRSWAILQLHIQRRGR